MELLLGDTMIGFWILVYFHALLYH